MHQKVCLALTLCRFPAAVLRLGQWSGCDTSIVPPRMPTKRDPQFMRVSKLLTVWDADFGYTNRASGAY
jgi:hypothetical protein